MWKVDGRGGASLRDMQGTVAEKLVLFERAQIGAFRDERGEVRTRSSPSSDHFSAGLKVNAK
jgi:hypothetical protein